MRTLLVISPNAGLAAALRAALDPSAYVVLEQPEFREEALRLTGAAMDVCVLDADLTTVEPIRTIERFRRLLPHCPLLLYASDSHRAWEEEAYLLGADYILNKPVRGRLLNAMLDRLLAATTTVKPRPWAAQKTPLESRPAEAGAGRLHELARHASAILGHDLRAEPLLEKFLLLLREILGLNRAAIFLRAAPTAPEFPESAASSRRLVSACALGLAPGVLENLALSLDAGVGGYLDRSGRVLRRDSAEVERDAQMAREFDLLGVRLAIPVLDRQSLIGVAMLDERITGEPMSAEELALIFHLFEQVGMAVKNIWSHEQISARQEMMFDILRDIKAGCLVLGRDMKLLHANAAARAFFPPTGRAAESFGFNDLPQVLGSKIFEVLRTGQPVAGFRFQCPLTPGQHFQVSITPFRKENSPEPTAALVVVEDCTTADRLHQLEIEAANLRLVKQMAERLAHEIGNAVVPISTHQQLMRERGADPEFQTSLATAMDEGLKRVNRLVDQMRFLARDRVGKVESVPVKQLIEEAFREARTHHPSTTVLLQYESSGEPMTISCDRLGLQHAFAEIMLNALQAGSASCQVHVRTRTETDSGGSRWAQIEVQDNGAGFSAEAADKAAEPFYTTRKVGLGLGLAVTSKIIQTHAGKLEIPPPRKGEAGLVRVSLPLAQKSSAALARS